MENMTSSQGKDTIITAFGCDLPPSVEIDALAAFIVNTWG